MKTSKTANKKKPAKKKEPKEKVIVSIIQARGFCSRCGTYVDESSLDERLKALDNLPGRIV